MKILHGLGVLEQQTSGLCRRLSVNSIVEQTWGRRFYTNIKHVIGHHQQQQQQHQSSLWLGFAVSMIHYACTALSEVCLSLGPPTSLYPEMGSSQLELLALFVLEGDADFSKIL